MCTCIEIRIAKLPIFPSSKEGNIGSTSLLPRGRSHLLSVLRVECLRISEGGITRNVVLGCHFVNERILLGQIMRDTLASGGFRRRDAGRTNRGERRWAQLETLRQGPGFRKIDR